MRSSDIPALTPEELAEIERRFENFDADEGTAYDMTSDDVPPHIRQVQAMAARRLAVRLDGHRPTRR